MHSPFVRPCRQDLPQNSRGMTKNERKKKPLSKQPLFFCSRHSSCSYITQEELEMHRARARATLKILRSTIVWSKNVAEVAGEWRTAVTRCVASQSTQSQSGRCLRHAQPHLLTDTFSEVEMVSQQIARLVSFFEPSQKLGPPLLLSTWLMASLYRQWQCWVRVLADMADTRGHNYGRPFPCHCAAMPWPNLAYPTSFCSIDCFPCRYSVTT